MKEKWKRKLLNRYRIERQEPKIKEIGAHTFFDKKKATRQDKFVISDSGATAHFLVEGAPIIDVRKVEQPITKEMLDGLLIYLLGTSSKFGHTMDVQQHNSSTYCSWAITLALISAKVFCNASCKVASDE